MNILSISIGSIIALTGLVIVFLTVSPRKYSGKNIIMGIALIGVGITMIWLSL